MSRKKTLRCPSHSSYLIKLDKDEIVPDDPGAGTPQMVHNLDTGASGTYWCALHEGMLDEEPIPAHVQRWLESDATQSAVEWVWE